MDVDETNADDDMLSSTPDPVVFDQTFTNEGYAIKATSPE